MPSPQEGQVHNFHFGAIGSQNGFCAVTRRKCTSGRSTASAGTPVPPAHQDLSTGTFRSKFGAGIDPVQLQPSTPNQQA
jgi:hypothetical protein